MRHTRFLRLLLLALLGAGLLLLYTWSPVGGGTRGSVAYAHAFVTGSDPVDGSTINTPPKVVRIFFDAPVSPISTARVYVFDTQAGREIDTGHSIVSPTNPRELDTPLANPSQLPKGIYEVKWFAVANDDGHTTAGLIGFNVGHGLGLQGNTILGPSTSNSPVQLDFIGDLSIAWEWLVLMALTFWVGILVAEGLLLGNDEETRATGILAQVRKQSLPLQWLALSAFLVGEIVNLFLRAIQLTTTATGTGGIDMGALGQLLFDSRYGALWITRVVLVVVAMGLLRFSNRPLNMTRSRQMGREQSGASDFNKVHQRVTQEQRNTGEHPTIVQFETITAGDTRGYIIIGLLLAGLLLLTYALTSDAAQLTAQYVSTVVLEWLYLAARSVWLGSLTYLGFLLLPLLPRIEQERQAGLLAGILRRFHPLLLGSVGVLLVSGLYLSQTAIFDPAQLITDPYGRSLLVTLALVALMLILSGFIIFIMRPRLARQTALLPVIDAEMPTRRTRQSALEQTERSIRRVLTALSVLGAGVLLCAAFMVFFAPPIVFPNIDYSAANTASQPPVANLNVQTEQVGDLTITLQVTPARSGYANTVILFMTDSSGNLVTNAHVTLTTNMVIMNMGTARTTIQSGNPTYIATFNKSAAFSMAGLWDITVSIQRPNQSPIQTIFQVSLNS